jgi:hypothetical protein
VHLQNLVRAEKHFLTELAQTDENQAESSQFPAETVDNLAGVGKSSDPGKVRNMSLFGRTKRLPRSRELQKNGA